MTAIGAATSDIALDMLRVMGLSSAIWLFYQIMCEMFPMKNRAVAFVLHIIFFACAGLVSFCFILGATASMQPRWHMALGFAVGAWVHFECFAPYVTALATFLRRLISVAMSPIYAVCGLIRENFFAPLILSLQKLYKLLYNSINKRREAKKRSDQDDSDENRRGKQKREAYTKT